ncbi:MAG: glycosyltransferase, partial [Candidatus Acidiferrales bacterium]
MKILYVDLETEWRGGQSQALEALRGLLRRGHEAQLLAVAGGALATRARDAGVRVIEIESRRKRWGAAEALRRLLRDAPPDVVHANESHALTAAWLARTHRRTTLVAARRLAYPIQRNPISRARFRAAHRIFAISDFV